MSNPVIVLEKISKKYQLYAKPQHRLREMISFTRKKYHTPFFALKELTLVVQRGETLGIIGENGSGKSTLLRSVAGVITPSGGRVVTQGRVVALLELGAGFNPEYSGIDNIILNGILIGHSKQTMLNKLPEILDFAEIGQFADKPIKTYSSGMFARLAFALAINTEPDILIIDEVLSVGDIYFQHKCFSKLKEMMERGITLLFVSHDLASVRQFCNTALWLQEGTIMGMGDKDIVCSRYFDFLLEKRNRQLLHELPENTLNIPAVSPNGSVASPNGSVMSPKYLNEQ